jgi:hypothetical protein
MSRSLTRLFMLGLLAGGMALIAATALAAPARAPAAKRAAHRAAASSHTTAPATAGMRAEIDPETGTIGTRVALPAIAKDGLPVVEDAPAELPITRLADGSIMMDLQGYFQDYALLTIDPSGKRVMTCTPHPRAALRTVPVAPMARPEK